MRFPLALLLPCVRRASRWSSPLAPRRARAPAASTPHAHEAASRNFAAPARTTDDERRDVRSAGVADWKNAERGNTERTLTAEAPPFLLATPIATPLQGGRPERSDLLFLKLLASSQPTSRDPRSYSIVSDVVRR